MADRRPIYGGVGGGSHPIADLLRQLQTHVPTSGQLFGFLALFISGGILLFLTGVTVTASVLGFIAFLPLIILSSPIWVPMVFLLGMFLAVGGSVVAVVAVVTWTYRYLRGMHPVGSGQVDYARARIYDTAAHVQVYARDYGGYLQSKVKDAAPGA
ncbi:PREDICTED: oleosin 16 kDa-like [Tarenaya hassleriana]|uniref:oleosin 16 kDa-like n=1 Tax=Tarenaya hassleriana TaxID=28532 RepID=UPI00053C468D|nr:PREDICTED: oleosin 16 kDa-like [Tarenaya hassleriana]